MTNYQISFIYLSLFYLFLLLSSPSQTIQAGEADEPELTAAERQFLLDETLGIHSRQRLTIIRENFGVLMQVMGSAIAKPDQPIDPALKKSEARTVYPIFSEEQVDLNEKFGYPELVIHRNVKLPKTSQDLSPGVLDYLMGLTLIAENYNQHPASSFANLKAALTHAFNHHLRRDNFLIVLKVAEPVDYTAAIAFDHFDSSLRPPKPVISKNIIAMTVVDLQPKGLGPEGGILMQLSRSFIDPSRPQLFRTAFYYLTVNFLKYMIPIEFWPKTELVAKTRSTALNRIWRKFGFKPQTSVIEADVLYHHLSTPMDQWQVPAELTAAVPGKLPDPWASYKTMSCRMLKALRDNWSDI